MHKKIIKKSIVVLLLAILLAQTVNAIGISPGSKKIDFEPNLKQELNFKVINNEKKDMNVLFSVEGELAQYVTLHNVLSEFKASEESKTFLYSVSLPAQIEKSGTHIVKVVATELPPEIKTEGNYVGARVGVVSRLEIQVPYPDKYAEAEVHISTEEPGKPAIFVVKVFNYGSEDIENAQATVDILGPTNEIIATVSTDSKPVKTKEIREIKASWIPENPGFYNADVRLRYDGKIANAEQTFFIGNLVIDLLNVEVKNFRLGGVAKFDLLVESKWNDMIKDVFAEITIKDKQGSEIATFKSTSADLAPLAKETIIAYWDTENIESGEYDATISINYGDKKTEKQFKADVSLDNIRISLIGATAQVVGSEDSVLSGSLIALLVAVLIVINIAWFIYFKRKLKAKK